MIEVTTTNEDEENQDNVPEEDLEEQIARADNAWQEWWEKQKARRDSEANGS